MAQTRKFAAAAGFVAALSMAATPAMAADIPAPAARSSVAPAMAYDADAGNAQNHRYYRYRPYRHNHVSTGDVLAGVLIIGGIAAIANAASKNRDERYRDRDYRNSDYRDRPYDYRERRGDSRFDGSRGIDRAVSMCVDRIERDVRVDSVDGVDRNGEGWRVTGTLYNGEGFTCRIGEDGRIDDVDFGGGLALNGDRQPVEDNQHSDDRYAAAWRDLDGQSQPAKRNAGASQPAYPGGPIDGDLEADEAGDDRYRIASAPAN